MACGKAADYKVFIKAQWWTRKASKKEKLLWEHLFNINNTTSTYSQSNVNKKTIREIEDILKSP